MNWEKQHVFHEKGGIVSMIWYVKKDCLHELNNVAKGDTRGITRKLHEMLEEEKAFTVHGYEHSLTPATQKAFQELIAQEKFVRVKVG